MKTKLHWITFLASAAMIAQANAGGQHGGVGGGSFTATAASSHGSGSPSGRGGSRSFAGGARMYGYRYSPGGARWVSPIGGTQRYYVGSGMRRFGPGTAYGTNHLARNRNVAAYGLTNTRRDIGARQARPGNNLPGNWRNHVTARHSADWHGNWDHNRDHVWHGHHCRFINGSWVIFDLGFYPWWPYWYPYDYYPFDYYGYPYGYDPNYYQNQEYYGDNGGAGPDQYGDPTVSAAQEQLAQEGYYRGEIDGVAGPQTQRAIARYQSNRGLHVTGYLTTETLRALGFRQVAGD